MNRLRRIGGSILIGGALTAASPAPDRRANPSTDPRPSIEAAGRAELSLVAFVRLEPRPSGDRRDPSRSQAVFVRSIGEQFASAGVRVLLVGLAPAEATPDELRNLTQAWNAAGVELVFDRRAVLAAAFGIRRLPTTVLLDRERRVLERWDGFAPVQRMAQSIREQLAAREIERRLD